MKKIPLLIALLLTVFCITSCKKIPELPNNLSNAIVGKQWKLTGFTENGVDKFNETYEPCERDDLMLFKSDGTAVLDDRATVCGDYDVEIIADRVKWSINNKILYLDFEFNDPDYNFTMEHNIIEISAKTLKYSLTSAVDPDDPDDTGAPVILVYTFTAQ